MPVEYISLSKAALIVAAFNRELRDWGWIVGLYGSILERQYGSKNDIDLIAFNRTDNTRPEDLDAFFEAHHFTVVSSLNIPSSNGRIYEYSNGNKKIRLDVHIRFNKGENWPD
jgi:hypothetical protein